MLKSRQNKEASQDNQDELLINLIDVIVKNTQDGGNMMVQEIAAEAVFNFIQMAFNQYNLETYEKKPYLLWKYLKSMTQYLFKMKKKYNRSKHIQAIQRHLNIILETLNSKEIVMEFQKRFIYKYFQKETTIDLKDIEQESDRIQLMYGSTQQFLNEIWAYLKSLLLTKLKNEFKSDIKLNKTLNLRQRLRRVVQIQRKFRCLESLDQLVYQSNNEVDNQISRIRDSIKQHIDQNLMKVFYAKGGFNKFKHFFNYEQQDKSQQKMLDALKEEIRGEMMNQQLSFYID